MIPSSPPVDDFAPLNMPTSEEMGFPQSSPPSAPGEFGMQTQETTGWLACNGRELLCRAYPNLFRSIGFLYNAPYDRYQPGYTGNLPYDATFRIPDQQGYFLRTETGNPGKYTPAYGTADSATGFIQPATLPTANTYMQTP